MSVRERLRATVQSPLRRNVGAATLLRPVAMATSFVWIPLAIKSAGVSRYGIWLALSAVFAWSSLARAGVAEATKTPLAEAFAAGDARRAEALISSAVRALAIGGAAIPAVGAALAVVLDVRGIFNVPGFVSDRELMATIALALIVSMVMMPLGLAGVVFEAYNRTYLVQVVSIASNLAGLGVLGVLYASSVDLSLVSLALLALAPPLVTNAVLVGLAHRSKVFAVSIVIRRAAGEPALRARRASTFLAFSLLWLVVYNTDNAVIANARGPRAAVPYATAFTLGLAAAGFVYAIAHPFWPAFTRAIVEDRHDWVRRRFRQLLLGTLGGCTIVGLGLVAAGPTFSRHWVGAAATPSRSLFVVVAVYIVIQAWTLSFFTLAAATDRLGGAGRFAVAEMAINVALSVVLVRALGPIGAAVGTVTSSTVTATVLAARGLQWLRASSPGHHGAVTPAAAP